MAKKKNKLVLEAVIIKIKPGSQQNLYRDTETDMPVLGELRETQAGKVKDNNVQKAT